LNKMIRAQIKKIVRFEKWPIMKMQVN
jgi:hypothetical protein